MEKHHYKNNSINKLNINNTLTDNPKEIAEFCMSFYQNIYESKISLDSIEYFFASIEENIKTIDENDKKLCDAPLSKEDVVDCIRTLKSNKSPGNDGLTSELYKAFSKELAPFLHKVFLESIEFGCLPASMTQGLINLIPKHSKDTLFLDHWHPICLLNNDYKIMALIFAKKIKNVLNNIIDESQSDFMKDRHIANNIRVVLDMLGYSDLVSEDSPILFLDFYKAFDTVEPHCIFKALDLSGFGEGFIKAIQTLYRNGNCSIKLQHGTSQRFNINSGIRQGCPISPYLFLLAMQLLAIHIKKSQIEGISIANKIVFISQLADDTTLFLRDKTQVSKAIDAILLFSKASGLFLNIM